MEGSPLIAAQTAGQIAFRSSDDSSLARRSHKEAAHGYSQAANDINDTEALRVLKLLESQHQQLSKVVKHTLNHSHPAAGDLKDKLKKEADNQRDSSKSLDNEKNEGLSPAQRKPPKELRSSIASNLATARGIPSAQQKGARRPARSPAQTSLEKNITNDNRPTKPGNQPASGADNEADQDDEGPQGDSESTQRIPQTASQDDAFHKFYTSFEGLFSKLSAPLAFAGLPLAQTEMPAQKTAISAQQKAGPITTTPDLDRMFSKAALQAVKEGNDRTSGVQDSFFVVPAGGGTISYARMLSKEERLAQQETTDTLLEEAKEDVFVDAQTKLPSSTAPLKAERMQLKSKKTNKTVEELDIENASLKKLTDNLSRRLYMWEKSSQSQTSALQQSMRLMHQPPAESGNAGQGAERDGSRVSELETQVASMQKDVEKYARDNEKLKATLARYRDRWEQLKAGARTRRDGGTPGREEDE